MNRQAIRDFLITVFFLGLSFIIAMLSSIAADQYEPKLAAIAAAISLLLAAIGALYIVPRLARNIRFEMMRFAVRTSVTVEGVLFVVFLLVIAFAAWNTGNNLLYLVFSAMVAFLVAANLIGRISIADVSVQLRFPDHIFAGEPSTIHVSVMNHKRLMPSYSFTIEALSDKDDRQESVSDDEDDLESEDEQASAASQKPAAKNAPRSRAAKPNRLGKLAYFLLVPAQSRARQRIEHTFRRRGRYKITGFRIATKFPAGFFKKWRRVDASGEIVVYPNPQAVDDFYHTLPMLVGQIKSHMRGSGDDLYAIRRYYPSDQMRHIDWKATAKASQLMVREKMREDDRRLTIVFDTLRRLPPSALADEAGKAGEEASERFTEQFERAVLCAASLAQHFIQEQSDVEFITTEEKQNVASGTGNEHLYKILRSLAMLDALPVADEEITQSQKKPQKKPQKKLRQSLLSRFMGLADAAREQAAENHERRQQLNAWTALENVPLLADERRFKVLITSAAKGTIPANVWRSAHVIYMEDL